MTLLMQSRRSLIIACPDCLCGRSIALIVVWLSVYMQHDGCVWYSHSPSSASCIPVISAVYMLNCDSPPRWWWLTSRDVAAYTPPPIFFSMPESSVYIVAMVASGSSCILSWVSLVMSFAFSILVFAFSVHHGVWIKGSIVSIASVMCENCCNVFSRFDRWGITAVLVLKAFMSDSLTGCFIESSCILVVARTTVPDSIEGVV